MRRVLSKLQILIAVRASADAMLVSASGVM
jgi:hypothetical protein